MSVSLKHAFNSAKSDGGDATLVQPSNWNAEHTLTLATGKVLGRLTAGTGAVEELTVTSFGQSLFAAADISAWLTASSLQTQALTWSGTSKFSKEFHFTGNITPTALASDTNDWAPTSASTTNRWRVSASSAVSLTGISASQTEGRLVLLDNVGSFNVKLVSESASSTAANRFTLPRDYFLRPGESVAIIYDGTSSRWRLVNSETYNKGPTVQRLTSGTAATYTTPAGATYLRIRMVGPGGGGAGSGFASWGAGGDGGAATNTSFGSTTAVYGSGAPAQTSASTSAAGGVGGSGGTTGTGTEITRHAGSPGWPGGMPYGNNVGVAAAEYSGAGANSVFGGGGRSVPFGTTSSAGATAAVNSGSGGASGYYNVSNNATGGGGGAGEYVEFYIYSPSATYTYTVPSGGAAGTAGSSGHAGGAGGAGVIIVEEFYV